MSEIHTRQGPVWSANYKDTVDCKTANTNFKAKVNKDRCTYTPTVLFKSLQKQKNGPVPIPHPSYPKHEEFLKSYKGKLKLRNNQ